MFETSECRAVQVRNVNAEAAGEHFKDLSIYWIGAPEMTHTWRSTHQAACASPPLGLGILNPSSVSGWRS